MAEQQRDLPGIYRRRIRIEAGADAARADLEDDPHRYGVAIRHDGAVVTAIEAHALRTPWALCPAAADNLQRLVGMALSPDPLAVYRHTAGGEQCTHMFDMAGCAIAQAARGIARRQYDIAVPVPATPGPCVATLARDGVPALAWTIDGLRILAPEPFGGRDLRTLLGWVRREIDDPDTYDAILLLRRAVWIAGSRFSDLDAAAHAADLPQVDQLMGACYVYRPGFAERAVRIVGSMRDFTHDAGPMLADLDGGAVSD